MFHGPLHPQRFVRTPLVVNLSELLQRLRPLAHLLRLTSMTNRFIQRAMESLHFPLRLRMAHSPESSPIPCSIKRTDSQVSP